MFSFLKSLFVSDPAQKLTNERDRKYRQAVEYQRNGNLREYASLIKEISILEDKICKIAEAKADQEDRDNITSTDFIDYDGMGNQGRFPSKLNKKDRS